MLKFNNTDITTGYIKQILQDANIPVFRKYNGTGGTEIDKEVIPSYWIAEQSSGKTKTLTFKTVVPYIKNNELAVYFYNTSESASGSTTSAEWLPIHNSASSAIVANPNNTKHFYIKNNIYDIYTHNYLGEYLRYLRDFKNLDLMSLYNCFGEDMPQILDCELSFDANDVEFTTKFTTTDNHYKIYMLPVKYLKTYTIAIDSTFPVEVFCGFYNTQFITKDPMENDGEEIEKFWKSTYQRFNSMLFSQPQVYTKLNWDNLANNNTTFLRQSKVNYAELEEDLKLFIKIPSNVKSSIVVLEGDYRGYNDRQFNINSNAVSCQESNHFVVNFEGLEERLSDNTNVFKPISYLQLLALNTGESHPFADRLLEYLFGSTIDCTETLEDNIKRVYAIMKKNNIDLVDQNDSGLWDDYIRSVMYSYMCCNSTNSIYNHDILGYIDKDVENNYKALHWVTAGEDADSKSKYYGYHEGTCVAIDTLKNIDIYEDIYKAAKVKRNKQ